MRLSKYIVIPVFVFKDEKIKNGKKLKEEIEGKTVRK